MKVSNGIASIGLGLILSFAASASEKGHCELTTKADLKKSIPCSFMALKIEKLTEKNSWNEVDVIYASRTGHFNLPNDFDQGIYRFRPESNRYRLIEEERGKGLFLKLEVRDRQRGPSHMADSR